MKNYPYLPIEIQRPFEEIYNELYSLNDAWNQFKILYTTSEAQSKLLKEAADDFFDMLCNVLLNSVCLNISVLTDLAKSGGNDNLSLGQLQQLISTKDKTLSDQLQILLDGVVKDKSKEIRKYRNKLVAHRDLDAVLHDKDFGLTVTLVDDAVKSLWEFLECIINHYGGPSQDFTIRGGGDARTLVRVIERHRNVLELKRDGKIEPELARSILFENVTQFK